MDTCTVRRIALLGLALAVIGPGLAAQDPEPIVGTWVLNAAKSTFTPGPGPKSETRTYVMEGQASKVTFKGVNQPRTYVTVRHENHRDLHRSGRGRVHPEERRQGCYHWDTYDLERREHPEYHRQRDQRAGAGNQ